MLIFRRYNRYQCIEKRIVSLSELQSSRHVLKPSNSHRRAVYSFTPSSPRVIKRPTQANFAAQARPGNLIKPSHRFQPLLICTPILHRGNQSNTFEASTDAADSSLDVSPDFHHIEPSLHWFHFPVLASIFAGSAHVVGWVIWMWFYSL